MKAPNKRADRVRELYDWIEAGTINFGSANLPKLRAVFAIDHGVTFKKFDEYIEMLIAAGRVVVDGEEAMRVKQQTSLDDLKTSIPEGSDLREGNSQPTP